MTSQLLFYESAVPVSNARHGNWCAEAGADYAFSRNVNSVPLMAVEFSSAASEFAIVFGGSEDVVMPVAVLGLRAQENLYLSKQGDWRARYIPAFVRRYPFVFSSRDQGKTFTLCIDETFPGFNQEGRGEHLFDQYGKPTPYVENMLKFLQQYQVEFERTQAFGKKLKDLNLLEPMQAQFRLVSGRQMALRGFSAVNRARLKTLAVKVLAELVSSDELELIYIHLVSMRNFAAIGDRLGDTGTGTGTGAGSAPIVQ